MSRDIAYFYLGYWDRNDYLKDIGQYRTKEGQLLAYYQARLDGFKASSLVKQTYYN